MTIKNPVEKAASMAKEVSASVADLVEIETRIDVLMGARRRLFKVEKEARKRLTDEINELKKQRGVIEALLAMKYKVMDLTPLTWRDRDGYPLLAVYDLNSVAKTEIAVRRMGWKNHWWENSVVPYHAQFREAYRDVLEMLEKQSKETKRDMLLRTTFDGVIPEDVRDEIRVMKGYFDEIYLIAEVDEWSLETVVSPAQRDPLVVGLDGETFFLMAAFDMTPLEEYLEKLSVKI